MPGCLSAVSRKSWPVSDRPALEEIIGCLPSIALLGYPESSDIVREGEKGDELYMLYRGTAGVIREGKEIASLVPGDFFGEIGFLVGVPRTATVRSGKSTGMAQATIPPQS